MIEHLKIGPHTYRVVRVPDEQLGEDAALVHIDSQLIQLQASASGTWELELLLHESLHAMLEVLNLKSEEQVVVHLGRELLRFFQDNHPLLRELLDSGKKII